MENLSITLIQANIHWEDISANLEMFASKINSIQQPTDLIILPEMFSTGFSMNAGKIAEDAANSKAIEWMAKMARAKNCVITGSLMLREKRKFFNRLIWMPPDGDFQTYDKRHLFSYAEEDKVYTAGEEKLIVQLKGWRIYPLVCYDLRFPVWARNTMSRSNLPAYDVLIYVANWPQRRIQAWKYLLIARAIENQSYAVGVNRVGNDGNDIYYSGDSMILDALGNILYHKAEEEDVCTIVLDYAELQRVRDNFRFLRDADSFALNQKPKIASH